jgi:release factor glutamine methyltransferase
MKPNALSKNLPRLDRMSLVSNDRSVRSLLRQGIEQLRAAQTPSYTLAAELLLLHVTGRDRTWLYSHADEVLLAEISEEYFALLRRRACGEPTQHLTGKQEFWGHEFEVTPDALIPRPETEHLIEVALDRLAVREIWAGRQPRLNGENVTLVDIGTGSGCIAITLAKELSGATIYATDISKAALEVARRNSSRLGVSDRIQFLESNLLEAFRESRVADHESPFFDLIISNPPYVSLRDAESMPIEVREHEPRAALFGGEEGYELYGALISQAALHLNPGGLLVLELGYNSLPAVQPLLDPKEWDNVGVTKDLAGIPRVIAAERLSPPR